LRELLERHQLAPSRALGQNFLVDPNTVRRIVRLAEVAAGDTVVEIGPGVGSLTLGLVEAGAQVVAVELDRHLLAALAEVTAGHDVRVLHGDALAVDWDEVLVGIESATLVANLPYNVGTTILVRVLDQVARFDPLLVMVQREVAERLVARAGDPERGIPSVLVELHATATIVGRVPPSVFVPEPRVESALVLLRRRPSVSVDRARLGAVLREGFGQRRKMLRRSLAGRFTVDELSALGIDPQARPQELTLEQWCRLAGTAGLGGVGPLHSQ
jgi:16S rRNA (adenine1518-N6/adenine1519-N6)-dimethyltransferase